MNTATKDRPLVIGLGEVLWDLLPAGKQLGGAPANFAYHAHALGAEALVVSRVGNDAPGREILDRLRGLGLRTDGITTDPSAPTGMVSVALDAHGTPTFTIHENVAWDFLEAGKEVLDEASRADAVCFGTLGQRNPAARAAISAALQATPPSALRIFDVNLRQHFWSREVIVESLELADAFKLNDEELVEVLASCASLSPDYAAWLSLYDDLECMTVNVPALTQIRFTPEFEAFLKASYGPDADAQLEIARRFDGTWSSSFFANDLARNDGLFLTGCCQFAGVTTLHAGWRNAMQWSEGKLRVNYLLNHSLPQAAMTTALPARGEARIRLQKMATVEVRVPGWLQPGDLVFKLEGRTLSTPVKLDASGRFAVLKDCPADATIEITFPVKERTTTERMGGVETTVRWRGNYAMQMNPLGANVPLLPDIPVKKENNPTR